MDKITDVAIDLDGVVYPFADAFKRYCVTILGMDAQSLHYPTRWAFYEDWGMTESEFSHHISAASHHHDLFATMPPEYYADYAWSMLRKMNLNIHVVTFRPKEAHQQTAEWLQKHNLVPDFLHFPTTSKGEIIKQIDGKVIAIDDHVDYYLDMKQAGALSVLRTQPWNEHHEDALRVSNLRNFIKLIEIYNTDMEIYE
jgi:hypothetical protein